MTTDEIAERHLASTVETACKVIWPRWARALSGFRLHAFRQSIKVLSNYGGCTMTLHLGEAALERTTFTHGAVVLFSYYILGLTDFAEGSEPWERARASRACWAGRPEPLITAWMRTVAHRYQAHIARAGAEDYAALGPMVGGPEVERWSVWSTPQGIVWKPSEVTTTAAVLEHDTLGFITRAGL